MKEKKEVVRLSGHRVRTGQARRGFPEMVCYFMVPLDST